VIAGGRWGGEASVFDSTDDAIHIARHDPARVLAECEAKRRLIDDAFVDAHIIDGEWGCGHTAEQIRSADMKHPDDCDGISAANDVLRILASVFRDHPDFDPAWSVTA
jgi:hypothetical protein